MVIISIVIHMGAQAVLHIPEVMQSQPDGPGTNIVCLV